MIDGRRLGKRLGDESEDAFKSWVLDLARIGRWLIHHDRPALDPLRGRYVTAIEGDEGFLDLVLVRAPRLVISELKTRTGKVTAGEERWLEALKQVPGVETYLWRPADRPLIQEVLR